MQTIGEKLRKKRMERKLKQEEVAEFLNISQRAYSKLENDEIMIKMDTLHQLSNFYQLPIAEFLPDSSNFMFSHVERCQIGDGTFNEANSEKSGILFDKIIERQQKEIDYLKGIIDILKK